MAFTVNNVVNVKGVNCLRGKRILFQKSMFVSQKLFTPKNIDLIVYQRFERSVAPFERQICMTARHTSCIAICGAHPITIRNILPDTCEGLAG